MSIADRYWGSQVAAGCSGQTHSDAIARGLDRLGLLIADAACTARLKGWTAVSIERNSDGRLGLTAERA